MTGLGGMKDAPPATIGRAEGDAFSLFGGVIIGRHVELVPNRRIVQAWRAKSWPKSHYSIATFELKRARGGTRLVFTQTGVPAEHWRGINGGWKSHYWDLLKKAFNKSAKR
jgi:activator of HSP90 ATPase